MPEGSSDADVPSAVPTPQQRLAAIRARKAERQAVRAEFAQRRAHGLPRRHAAKLRNLAAGAQHADQPADEVNPDAT